MTRRDPRGRERRPAAAGVPSSSAAQKRAAPSDVPWPPLLYGGMALLAVALGYGAPAGDWFPAWARAAGAVVMLAGLGLDGSAMLSMRRHHANILPHRPATALVTSWPFSVSRNPIYLATR